MKNKGNPEKPLKPFLFRLFFTAFILNWFWEMAHMFAYEDMAGKPLLETVPRCTAASVMDGLIALGIYALSAFSLKDMHWAMKAKRRGYFVVIFLGALTAIIMEWAALEMGQWAYNDRMPVILGIGLTPFLQLTLLVPISILLASLWLKRSA